MTTRLDEFEIIDTDTHVAEPPDLWTSRVPKKWQDRVPTVKWDEAEEREMWVMGDQPIAPPGIFAMAGHDKYAPDCPKRLADADPASWDSKARIARMDLDGIRAQVLYSNVALFSTHSFTDSDETQLRLECVRAYNDFQTEFASVAPERLLPMTVLPFWSIEESLEELKRCRELGHRGIAFSQEPAAYGLPRLMSRHWDPLWAAVQDAGMSVNFHVAAISDGAMMGTDTGIGSHATYANQSVSFFMSNAKTMAGLIFSGICHRFPNIDFVSVESGVGWIPTSVAFMDWQWINSGVYQEHPEYDLLPSEYFKRQIYGCFWMERETALHAFDQLGPDNFFFESDFPHGTCLAPGPATTASAPRDFLAAGLAQDLPDDVLRKVLFGNAARVYSIS
ncbi:MAG TPA: amidohydrolase family protein [Candidatus Acidoferrum sp.]|jgi:predicted TIM-barrel fold metal-dependent hydrolase|nr:amidohydrolase family protein [Candidatus Acidoferrum sp.]